MSAWPSIKTARALALEEIVPCSEDVLKALAKAHGIGRKLGRAYVFTPDDVRALLEKLPCPSSSSDATAPHTGTSAGLSEESAWMKARELATRRKRNRSASSAKASSSKGRSTVIPLSAHLQRQP